MRTMKKFGEDEAGLQMLTFQSQVVFSGKPYVAYYFRDPPHLNFHQGHNLYKSFRDLLFSTGCEVNDIFFYGTMKTFRGNLQ